MCNNVTDVLSCIVICMMHLYYAFMMHLPTVYIYFDMHTSFNLSIPLFSYAIILNIVYPTTISPMGVYVLTSTALYSQKQTIYHVTKMKKLATDSASLFAIANAELESSVELESKSAIDSEEGMALQTESLELEVDAEEMEAKSAAETILGEELTDEAEMLHEKSARDSLESEVSFSQSKEMQLQSKGLHTQAEKDRAAAAFDEAKSVTLLEEASKAESLAAEYETEAAEYEAIVLKREGQSIKDGVSDILTLPCVCN